MSIRWLLPLAAPMIVALASVATLAGASPALDVSVPPECPGALALERAVSAHVGRVVRLDGVSVSIRRAPAAWHARLRTEDGDRELDAETCEAALEAVALVLALAVGPEPKAEAQTLGTPAAPSPTAQRTAAAPMEDAPARDARAAASGPSATHVDTGRSSVFPQTRDHGLSFGLGVGLLGEVGVLPAASLGGRVAIHARSGAWRLELAGLALLPRRAELGDGELSAQIGWWAAQLAACRRLIGTFEGCLGSELGELGGEGSGVDAPRRAHGTWFAETLATVWSAPWPNHSGPWSWQLGANLAIAVVRPEFGFDGLGVLHRPSPVSGRLWLAIDWR